MASPVRFNDGRYSKHRTLAQRQDSWVEELQRQIDSRPKSRYALEEMVLTPIGMKRIVGKHHRGSGWHYSFWTTNGRYTYSEKQLLSQGDGLLLKDVMKIIRAGG